MEENKVETPEQFKDIKVIEQGPVKYLDRKHQILEDALRVAMVILATAIYSFSVKWFLEPANLISIGVTALSQITSISLGFAGVKDIPLGVYTFIFNLPLVLIGIKYVSPRFIIFTAISVVTMSLLLTDWIPSPAFIVSFTDSIKGSSTGAFNSNTLFLAIIGGLFAGVGNGLALRYGGSTGGVDVISQVLKLRKNISISTVSIVINIGLAVIGGILQKDLGITLCTFIFIILLYIVVDKIHTGYNTVRIDIITKDVEGMSDALIRGIGRGCSVLEVKGAFTHEKKYDVFMVVSYYELDKAKKIIRNVDPHAWITIIPVKRVIGVFFRHTIS